VRRSLRHRLLRDERGLSTVEYVLIVALVAIVAFVAWQMIGRSAASRNRAAEGVVDDLHTHSTEDESGASGGGGRRTAAGPTGTAGSGSGATMVDAMHEEEASGDAGLWRWGAVALAVFGGMIYWLAKDKK
jgi:Flp pilus assembly pilin Flp